MPVIGFLRSTSLADVPHFVTAFRQGLKEAGFVEGQNVAIEYRSAEDQPDRLPALVADLIRRPVAVIVGNNASALAAKAATTTVPIVFATGGDPVQRRPRRQPQPAGRKRHRRELSHWPLGAKRLELLRQLVPKAAAIAVLVNPSYPQAEAERRDVQAAARAIGQEPIVVEATASATSRRPLQRSPKGAGALLVGTGGFLLSQSGTARCAGGPTCNSRDLCLARVRRGRRSDELRNEHHRCYRQAGVYAGRILKGEKPADLPVLQSTKFEFVINLKTAKALGLEFPDSCSRSPTR